MYSQYILSPVTKLLSHCTRGAISFSTAFDFRATSRSSPFESLPRSGMLRSMMNLGTRLLLRLTRLRAASRRFGG